MKGSLVFVAALAGVAAAMPRIHRIDKRQMTQTDVEKGAGCKKITLIFARASTEPGNMGMSMGPAVCSGLKTKYGAGNVACQGVGGPYSAGLGDNVMPAGTTAKAYEEAERLFKMAASKCPDTTIVAGGYSQGTAVMMNAISKLDAPTRERIAGVVLFGYTKNAQQKSGIPNYPKENVKVFCSSGDGVCGGQLLVTIGHFSYMGDGSGPGATKFLSEKINAASKGGAKGEAPAAGGSEGGASEEAAPEAPKGKKGSTKNGKKGGSRVVEDITEAESPQEVVEETSV